MSKDLYDIVGDKIIEFCEKTYYSDIVCSFEQSYNGKEWTKEVEFATFYNGTNLCYENDWNEGQTHLRNLRIWHLEDSEPVKGAQIYEKEFSAKGFTVQMRRIKRQCENNPEVVHLMMDECMCELLRKLGYSKGVQIFEDTEKWYA